MPRIDFSRIPDLVDQEFIKDLFEEIGLTLGGAVAIHLPSVDPEMDDFLWTFCRNLDVIRLRALKRVGSLRSAAPRKRPNLKPHPAIYEFMHPTVHYDD